VLGPPKMPASEIFPKRRLLNALLFVSGGRICLGGRRVRQWSPGALTVPHSRRPKA